MSIMLAARPHTRFTFPKDRTATSRRSSGVCGGTVYG